MIFDINLDRIIYTFVDAKQWCDGGMVVETLQQSSKALESNV